VALRLRRRAQNVKLRLPAKTQQGEIEKFELKPDVLVAEAELKPNEIQDLADQLAEIKKAAGAIDLRFRLRVEVNGKGSVPAPSLIGKLNELLKKVSDRLFLK
jgi:hypothetical protein